ncbi:hypothetical protein [Hansschlegelia sp. KR7-227]|uniref:hypothetical protein n=1 Tax=Hansschlegelia sp. KR7-227 TaxID=3400914 RepID=UPI003C105945
MICSNCGGKISAIGQVCQYCGADKTRGVAANAIVGLGLGSTIFLALVGGMIGGLQGAGAGAALGVVVTILFGPKLFRRPRPDEYDEPSTAGRMGGVLLRAMALFLVGFLGWSYLTGQAAEPEQAAASPAPARMERAAVPAPAPIIVPKPVALSGPRFDDVVRRLRGTLSCRRDKITPAMYGDGRLYGCISGSEETAKVFVNETPAGGGVENIKIMWNDYFRDGPWGLHADSTEAGAHLYGTLAVLAPDAWPRMKAAFAGSAPVEMAANGYTLRYTWTRGPSVHERLVTMTPAR